MWALGLLDAICFNTHGKTWVYKMLFALIHIESLGVLDALDFNTFKTQLYWMLFALIHP